MLAMQAVQGLEVREASAASLKNNLDNDKQQLIKRKIISTKNTIAAARFIVGEFCELIEFIIRDNLLNSRNSH